MRISNALLWGIAAMMPFTRYRGVGSFCHFGVPKVWQKDPTGGKKIQHKAKSSNVRQKKSDSGKWTFFDWRWSKLIKIRRKLTGQVWISGPYSHLNDFFSSQFIRCYLITILVKFFLSKNQSLVVSLRLQALKICHYFYSWDSKQVNISFICLK